MAETPLAFEIITFVVLALFFIDDLFVIGRRPHVPSTKECVQHIAFFVVMALIFGGCIWFFAGSKPAIESTAVANATGLAVPSNGLQYPPASVEDIPYVTRPIAEGGVLEQKGMVEVISSLEKDGRKIPYDIRMGVWVTVEGESDYIRHCFEEYNAHTDPSGRYFTLYKRWHLIGLEVGMSVASVALRGEATGVAQGWNADVVATAKRDLRVGELLDGEGGYTVWGKLLPAATSRALGGLPLGLAHGVKLVRPVAKGQSLCWDDVAMDTSSAAYRLRREMQALQA